MQTPSSSTAIQPTPIRQKSKGLFYGGAIWVMGIVLLVILDRHLDETNLGLLLVLTSVLASVCLPLRISLLASVVSLLGFDWFFIPPNGSLRVDLHQHALMLIVMLVVNWVVIILVWRQRSQAERTKRYLHEANLLRDWSNNLHQAAEPHQQIAELQLLLQQITATPVMILILKNQLPALDDTEQVVLLGDAGIEQRHALWYCTRNAQPLGRGTGRYEMFSDVYLPLRARGQALGAALLCNFAVHDFSTRIHLQAICDQMGNALDRYRSHQQDIAQREAVQSQLVRNNLLAAISHDYRTPLATIMGAASSLNEQIDKLDIAQQHLLAHRIYDEAERLNKMTSEILQLARLDGGGQIHCDWQSAEELVGDMQRRWRARGQDQRLVIQLQENLPLLWCDELLIGQLLENLVDNALKYSPENAPVKIAVSADENTIQLHVIDQGKGIDAAWMEKIFEPFQRGPVNGDATETKKNPVLGAGVGLALCRAIAKAHEAQLRVYCSASGGCDFELALPRKALPLN